MSSGRAPNARAAGGGRLLLLGVLLALAAGIVVLYAVSRYTASGAGAQVTAVVAKEDLQPHTILTMDQSGPGFATIGDAFTTLSVNVGALPLDAYPYTTQEDLNSYLNGKVVVQTIYAGDFLRKPDGHIAEAGSQIGGDLNNINPTVTANMLLVELQLSTTPAVVMGDRVDIIVTECNIPGRSGCVTQDTLKDVYVYTVQGDAVFLVLDAEDAIRLQTLEQSGHIELALRGATYDGPNGPNSTTSQSVSSVVGYFGF